MPSSGPLDDVRILALSQFGAGPFGMMQLADLGADVIKIEDPLSGGDVGRYVQPGSADGDGLYYQSFNRNTRSIALNLREPDGRRSPSPDELSDDQVQGIPEPVTKHHFALTDAIGLMAYCSHHSPPDCGFDRNKKQRWLPIYILQHRCYCRAANRA